MFLCGYAVQQKTLNDIREAIKPAPRPVHTNLYVPPKPGDTPADNRDSRDSTQVVEIVTEEENGSEQKQESEVKTTETQTPDDAEAGDQLVQGSDGGLIRASRQGRKKQKAILEDSSSADLESYMDGISNPRKSPEASTADSRGMLSRAARRKILKEELAKLAGDEKLLNNPNVYRRRRLW